MTVLRTAVSALAASGVVFGLSVISLPALPPTCPACGGRGQAG